MSETIKNILYILAVGTILFFGVFALRFLFRLTWKFVRVVLIIFSLILIAGYFMGHFEIVIH